MGENVHHNFLEAKLTFLNVLFCLTNSLQSNNTFNFHIRKCLDLKSDMIPRKNSCTLMVFTPPDEFQRLVESVPKLSNTSLQKHIPSFSVLMIVVESAV